MRKTKIICTLGPSTEQEDILRQVMLSGMDVARLNFSHGDHAWHKKTADLVKRLRAELNLPIPLLLDTKGPEIRLGLFKNGGIDLKEGQLFTLTTDEVEGDDNHVSVSYKGLPTDVIAGARILINDGLVELAVQRTTKTEILCKALNAGRISDQKGVNVPGIKLSMPFVSENDKSDLLFGIENDFDFVAVSFTRCAADILAVRSILENNGGANIRIISKIENSGGLDNLDEIIRVSDGIMVARGDMGVEIPLEEIPRLQKMIIKKVYKAGKIVITATQMLESMIQNPRPTRAETTDVANAIYDGTSAIMLSGETAAGRYPIESVKTMARIAEYTEQDIDYKKRFSLREAETVPNVTNAISHATCMTAHDLGATAIITVTKSGQTARNISKFRPACTILGCTPDEKVYRQLILSWGVQPLFVQEVSNTEDLFDRCVRTAVEKKYASNGDLVVITAGVPLRVSGTTNLLKVHIVGNVLVQGIGIVSQSVCGNLCVCANEEAALRNFHDGDILVIPQTSNRIMSLIKKCSGIIAEQGGASSHAAVVGLTLDLPVIVGATNATAILKSGTTVTLDGQRGIVYSGENEPSD
ncbi:MAG: pyruvate kinase [Clostridia bacterium]|nr:pyruvate kinase [Clostridia bacterium]MDR3645067.1 pyruvate kinase [Clostridia bacterium]